MITDIASFKEEKSELYARLCQTAQKRQAHLQLLMEHVDNPANLGAIARSCDAMGVQQISYLPSKRHVREKRLVIKSSVAASQWLDFTPFEDTETYFDQLKQEGWTIVGTTPNAATSTSLYDIDFTKYPMLAVAIGSESRGLSETAFAKVDMILHIPMAGVVESFNVSVAAAIILSEICRQRCENKFLLDKDAQKALVDHWIERLIAKRYFKK